MTAGLKLSAMVESCPRRTRHKSEICRVLLALLLPGAIAICVAGWLVTGAGRAATSPAPKVGAANRSQRGEGEENPGGNATTQESIDTREAFSRFSHGIGFEGEAKFKSATPSSGKVWVRRHPRPRAPTGSGPLFNSRACQSCHLKDGRGHPPERTSPTNGLDVPAPFHRRETDEQGRLVADHRVNTINEPTYGEQLQNLAVQGLAARARWRSTTASSR